MSDHALPEGYNTLLELQRDQDLLMESTEATPESIMKLFKAKKNDGTQSAHYFGGLDIDTLVEKFHEENTVKEAREATIMAMFQTGMASELVSGDRASFIQDQISRWNQPAFEQSGEKARVAQYLGVDARRNKSEEALGALNAQIQSVSESDQQRVTLSQSGVEMFAVNLAREVCDLIHKDRPVTHFTSELPSDAIELLPRNARSIAGATWTFKTATNDARIQSNTAVATDVGIVEKMFRKSMFGHWAGMRDHDPHEWLSTQAGYFREATDPTQPEPPTVDSDLFIGGAAEKNLADYQSILKTATDLRRLTNWKKSQSSNNFAIRAGTR